MKKPTCIVAGGGWVRRQTVGKPKARLFGFLSIAWPCLAFLVAVLSLDLSATGEDIDTAYFFAFLPEPFFVLAAVVFWRLERPRSITDTMPNPEYDPGKLY